MPRTLWLRSRVPATIPYYRNGRVASGRGIDASDALRPDRLPTWSTEITPGKQSLELYSRVAEILLGTFEAIDHGYYLQYCALKLPGQVDRSHHRAPGGGDVFEQNDPRSSVEQSINPLVGAVALGLLADKEPLYRLLGPAPHTQSSDDRDRPCFHPSDTVDILGLDLVEQQVG